MPPTAEVAGSVEGQVELSHGEGQVVASEIERVLSAIAAQMDLDTETERELLEEIQSHLEEATAASQTSGLDRGTALSEAAARLGVEEVGVLLQQVHAGRGTADAVIAAALPVLCALVLRWLVFAPDGTALGWPKLLARPALWVVAAVALLLPLLRFSHWRYGLASWAFFWGITVIFAILPAVRW